MDRIDLRIEVPAVTAADLILPPSAEGSAEVAARVAAARDIQSARYTAAGLPQIVSVIALLAWPQTARVMRGEVMRVKQLEFVDAVRCLGYGEGAILLGEIVPNAIAPMLAVGTG